ncbi:MAG: hypothetical protein ABS34_10900 [Opitutaceae bacterium BACL24 MAG-120322-bin51]|jgi:hypothetical protein|nr:MAG: hypothetical protein ABS34_10900 [Opitutaceae bacterium BACL24 MAG-120322-bin51]
MKTLTLHETKIKGLKTLIALVIIAVSVYLGFTPLFKLVPDGVAQQVVGSSFGAIFVIILTMYLLNKQTEIEQESKRGERVFDEKVKLYQMILKTSREIIEDGILTSTEVTQLPFAMVNLQMLGADETIKSYSIVFEKINEIFSKREGEDEEVKIDDDDKIEIFKAISHFSIQCRNDLGISDKDVDPTLFNRAFQAVQTAVKNKRDTKKIGYKGTQLSKGRLVLSIFKDYVAAHPNVDFEGLEKAYPALQGKRPLFLRKEDAEKIYSSSGNARHFIKPADLIELRDGAIAISNQWGASNLPAFLDHCRNKLGIDLN